MTTTIHIDLAEQDPDLPRQCTRTDCPGERGWEVGYGMAGGGMGVYSYCNLCEQVVDKTQDPTEDL